MELFTDIDMIHMMYLHATYLHSANMSQCLPTANFKQLFAKETQNLDISSIEIVKKTVDIKLITHWENSDKKLEQTQFIPTTRHAAKVVEENTCLPKP